VQKASVRLVLADLAVFVESQPERVDASEATPAFPIKDGAGTLVASCARTDSGARRNRFGLLPLIVTGLGIQSATA